ncbi:MAG: hypothetical protein KJT03_20455, partial [Verrucomicrobiae bacterium]|nr:hypothetical protein [Verrucomicrobiae bacterium]
MGNSNMRVVVAMLCLGGLPGADSLFSLETKAFENVIVYYEPGRFGGWPANAGVWNWGDEILVGFGKGYFEDKPHNHSINKNKPNIKSLARSLDGGVTWTVEERRDLNGDGAVPCPGGIDFAHPDFALIVNRTYFQV